MPLNMDNDTPWRKAIRTSSPKNTVFISLLVTDPTLDPFTHRRFSLNPYSQTFRVGRGSKSGSSSLMPSPDNAWFESRVVSRTHAVFKADTDYKTLSIQDVGSMHGTFVNEDRLENGGIKRLENNDSIQFGSRVTRASETFPPLKIRVNFDWEDMSTRSFEVPDQSDSEIEIIEERRSIHRSSSDISAPGSFRSVVTDYDPSRPTSPDMPSPAHNLHTEIKDDVIVIEDIQAPKEKAHGSDENAKINNKSSQIVPNEDFWRTPSYIEGLAEDEDAIRGMNADLEEQDHFDRRVDIVPSSAQASSKFMETDSEDDSVESVLDDSDESEDMDSPPLQHDASLGLSPLSRLESLEKVRNGRDALNDFRSRSPEIFDGRIPQDSLPDSETGVGAEKNNRGRKLAVTNQTQPPRTVLLAEDCLISPDPERSITGSEILRVFTKPRENQSKKESRNQPVEQDNRRESIPPLDFDHAPEKLSASFGPAGGPYSSDLSKLMSRVVRDPSPSDAAMAKAVDTEIPDYHPHASSQGPQPCVPHTVPMTADYLSSGTRSHSKTSKDDHMQEDGSDSKLNLDQAAQLSDLPPSHSPLAESTICRKGRVSGDAELPSIARLKEESVIESAEPATGAFMGQYLHPNNSLLSQAYTTHPHREKIKVGDLVDSTTNCESQPPRGLKRKAHQISEDEDTEFFSEDRAKAWAEKAMEKIPTSSSQVENMNDVDSGELVKGMVPVSHTLEERAVKRVKTGKERCFKVARAPSGHSRGRTLAKYAATAVSGAVAGAVGVVALLINLPDNYFG